MHGSGRNSASSRARKALHGCLLKRYADSNPIETYFGLRARDRRVGFGQRGALSFLSLSRRSLARADGIRLVGAGIALRTMKQAAKHCSSVVATVLDAHMHGAPAVCRALRSRRGSGKDEKFFGCRFS